MMRRKTDLDIKQYDGWQYSSTMNAPRWIQRHIETGESGGWAHPLWIEAGHPVIEERWRCLHCDMRFWPNQHIIVTPMTDSASPEVRWVAYHRDCLLASLGVEDG